MFKTRITKLLGIQYPILQGAMLWLSKAELVAAVSEAGGLGILSSASFSDKVEFREEIIRLKKKTKKPFAVNLVYLPFEREISNNDFLEVIIEEKVPIIETVGIVPSGIYQRVKQAGILCLHKVTSVRHARNAEANGADAVCLEGLECAGHPGMDNIGSLILIQRAVESLSIPVIAAGGFVDGKGLAAALALGAEAVLMGTRFLMTQECPAHERIKEWCLQADETDTILGLRLFRDPVRYMKTELAEKVLELESKGSGLKDLMPIISGFKNKLALESGDLKKGVCSCGQSVGLIHDIPPVKKLVERIMIEAEDALKNLIKINS